MGFKTIQQTISQLPVSLRGKLWKATHDGVAFHDYTDTLPRRVAPDFVKISAKRAINRNYFKGSAKGRMLCVLAHDKMADEVELPVPENRQKQVWGELLG